MIFLLDAMVNIEASFPSGVFMYGTSYFDVIPGVWVWFVVGLGLSCSLVLWYAVPMTLIWYDLGSLMGLYLLSIVPGMLM